MMPTWARDLVSGATEVQEGAQALHRRSEELLRSVKTELATIATLERELGDMLDKIAALERQLEDALDGVEGSRATIARLEGELKEARAALGQAGVKSS